MVKRNTLHFKKILNIGIYCAQQTTSYKFQDLTLQNNWIFYIKLRLLVLLERFSDIFSTVADFFLKLNLRQSVPIFKYFLLKSPLQFSFVWSSHFNEIVWANEFRSECIGYLSKSSKAVMLGILCHGRWA